MLNMNKKAAFCFIFKGLNGLCDWERSRSEGESQDCAPGNEKGLKAAGPVFECLKTRHGEASLVFPSSVLLLIKLRKTSTVMLCK